MRIATCTVLIVGSAPAERRTYQHLLTADPIYHYAIVEAVQGAQALAFCQESPPACILIASHLPDTETLTLLHELIRLLGPHGAAFVLVLDAQEQELARLALQHGAHAYVTKEQITAAYLQQVVRLSIECATIRADLALQIREREQIEEQLRYQTSLLENVQDAVIATDTHFRILTWNRGAEQLYGWLAIEVIGRRIGELLQTEYLNAQAADVMNSFLTDGRWQGEVFHRTQKGERITIANTTVLLRDANGRPVGAVAVNRDITARKAVEENRQRSEQHLRNIIDNVAAFVGIITPEGILIEANRTALQAANLTPADVIGKHFADTYWWSYSAPVQTQLRAAIARAVAGELVRYDVLVRLSDERYSMIDFMLAPICDEKGAVTYLVPSAVDVTERRQAESALRDSEAHFRSLFASMTQGVVYHNAQGQIIDANAAAEAILGLSLSQMQGRVSIDPRWRATSVDGTPFPGDEHPAMVALRTGQVIQDVVMGIFQPGRNEQRWLLVDAVPQFRAGEDRPYQVYALFSDFTERKWAEESLRQTSEQLRLALDAAYLIAFSWEIATDEVQRLYSTYPVLPPTTQRGPDKFADVIQAVHPEDRAMFRAHVERALANPTQPYRSEFRLINSDGTIHWLAEWGRVECDEQGRPLRLVGLSMDVTEQKAAEAALRQQATMLETTHDAIFMWELQGAIVYWNQGAERLYGYSKEEALGQRSHALLQTALPQPPALFEAKIAAEGEWRGELHHTSKNGEQRIVLSRHQIVHQADGRQFVLETSYDITQRKQVEAAWRASEERLRLALVGGGMGVWEWHATTDRSVWDEQEYRLFGLPPDTEINQQTFENFVDPVDWPELSRVLAHTLHTGGDYTHEYRIRHATGEVRWLAERGSGIMDEQGQVTRLLGINFDITERKAQEEALHQYNVLLEERVTERTAALKAANEKLAVTNRELEQFTYAAAHDLKSPLRGIQNLAKFLIEDVAALLPPKSQKHLALLQGRAHRLEQLLNGLLDYSRIGREHYAAETVNTQALVEEITELLAPPVDFTITAASLPILYTYRVPLSTVLHNLLSNAIKHHHQPALGQIQVTARLLDNRVEFSVSDNGPGIAPEFHKRIFDMFQTLQSRDQVEGSGIGLALVKKTVEGYGGQITLESTLGQGATFRFTWPIVR